MSDHLVLYVDRLVRPAAAEPVTQPAEVPSEPAPSVDVAGPSGSASSVDDDARSEHDEGHNEDEPLIQTAECRICQEEDSVKNLEAPCACSGSLKVYLPILFAIFDEFQSYYIGFNLVRCIDASEMYVAKEAFF